jgi:hypothetical protein
VSLTWLVSSVGSAPARDDAPPLLPREPPLPGPLLASTDDEVPNDDEPSETSPDEVEPVVVLVVI